MIFYNIPWIIPYIGELVHMYKYELLVYRTRVFVLEKQQFFYLFFHHPS